MFTIIGGDGREYGPVTAEQVRAWIAAGRATLDTKARRDREVEWRRLGDFAEFGTPATPLAHDTPASVPPPSDYRAYAADLIARAAKIDVISCFERSWELLKSDFWGIVGVTTVVLLVTLVASVIPVLKWFVTFFLSGVFYGGLYAFYLKKLRGHTATLGDAFSGFSVAFIPLALATAVTYALVALGFVLLILPGIYLAVAYSFALLLIVDKKLPFWDALEVSRRVITAQWWRVFFLLILGAIIGAAGVLALFVGLFITMPIAIGAVTVAYERLCNPPPRA
ncbi:GYF domain-containing protein [Horticoccus luteus]|uniref:GYF domain-containing protein n=1 Tax=Horticoccus luteus TaxID=2862869 RepID=A0A8F9TWP3_9BACT|nr:GYF domain-containing protein [Horticoccus luteus]QYM79204.1 GYF domain-containing protein [Horticoccus luteus]